MLDFIAFHIFEKYTIQTRASFEYSFSSQEELKIARISNE